VGPVNYDHVKGIKMVEQPPREALLVTEERTLCSRGVRVHRPNPITPIEFALLLLILTLLD